MAMYEDLKRVLQDIMVPQLAEIRGEMHAMRADMDRGFAEVRAEMDKRFAQVDTKFVEVRAEIAKVRSEMTEFRAEMRQEINNVHTDLVRIEQVFDARLQTVGVIERLTRLEERVGAKPAPAA